MKNMSELPPETRKMAEEFFDCIGKAFTRG